MTLEVPNWLQNGAYAARLDRAFIERIADGRERVFDGLDVTEATPSPNFTVDVAAGAAVIMGDDQANQGMYFVRSTATESIAVPASPGAGTRTDSVIARVNDSQAGGGVGDDFVIEVIEGTTIPATAVLIASIARTDVESAITTAAITDARPLGAFPYGVGTGSPPDGGVENDLYIRVT